MDITLGNIIYSDEMNSSEKGEHMKNISVLIKPASSLCNMRCRYCFYADVSTLRSVASYGMMDISIMEKIVDNIYHDLSNGDNLTIAFQGGEPMLAGLEYFRNFVAYVKKQPTRINVKWSLQTNGILLNGDWCSFLRENQFLVGLSLDGDAALHNAYRRQSDGRGTWNKVMHSKRLLDKYGVEYNILTVLTETAAKHPQKIWNFMLRENIRYVQFIPCLDNLDATNKSPFSITPRRIFSFYETLFQLWKCEVENGRYISVRFFDDIVNLFGLHRVTSCGQNGQCHKQFVVESNGGVYPCDFYVLDEWLLGNLTQDTLLQSTVLLRQKEFILYDRKEQDNCKVCSFRSHCAGGCKRMRNAIYFDAKDGFCGLQAFLDSYLYELCQIGIRITRGEIGS